MYDSLGASLALLLAWKTRCCKVVHEYVHVYHLYHLCHL